jgi:hypothetical protein
MSDPAERALRECGACGAWTRHGNFFQSGVTRDGATPRDNFVCVHCQREAAEGRSLERAVDRYEQRRSLTRLARSTLAFDRGIGQKMSHDSVLQGRQRE